MKAIFIDGVGRREDRDIPSLLPVLFPRFHAITSVSSLVVPPRPSLDHHHKFRLLGSNRSLAVYGYVFDTGPQYRLAYAEAIWTPASTKMMILQALRELDRQIKHHSDLGVGPVYPLVDFIRVDTSRRTVTMMSLFVFRSE